ncbi:hypothetical protein O9993_03140 [Vibrio lentus]|nr:hypothetical protein [Vibrio lentus]
MISVEPLLQERLSEQEEEALLVTTEKQVDKKQVLIDSEQIAASVVTLFRSYKRPGTALFGIAERDMLPSARYFPGNQLIKVAYSVLSKFGMPYNFCWVTLLRIEHILQWSGTAGQWSVEKSKPSCA